MSSQQLDEEAIFHIARKLEEPENRDSYLDQICAGDHGLRERVEALLEVHEKEAEFLKSSPEAVPTVDHTPITETAGHQIGRYKLLQQIGEGGFGVVYMAEQTRPVRRKVALKIIKPGMETHAVVARFEAERQALALMDHPNIARVLDGGATDSGRPYFVMELVKGVPITEYCDKNQLSTEERLNLFTTICRAVQHAHQKGIIHRDLKPSNILVTLADGEPVVKVIDFGVSKALNQQLTEKTLFTAYGQMIGTPQYMSPEQAEMSCLDVDTRSDIYSLGVLLYELLTETTPLEGERLRTVGYAEMQRVIQEEEPPKPSLRLSSAGERLTVIAKHRNATPESLQKKVRGDLDWIVMKALEKERGRRYETTISLSNDVRRFLNDEAVLAYPPSAVYRLRKFARRNKAIVASTFAIASILLSAVLISLSQKHQAEREREAAIEARYVSDMHRAMQAYEENDLQITDNLLRQYWPQDGKRDLRDNSWYFMWKACAPTWQATKFPIENYALDAALSPDGKTLAFCPVFEPVTLLDLGTGQQKTLGKSLRDERGGWPPACVDWSSKNILAYPSSDFSAVILRDMTTQSERVFQQDKSIFSIKVSPKGGTLAVGLKDEIVLCNLDDESQRESIPAHSGTIEDIAFTPDERFIVAVTDSGGVMFYDRSNSNLVVADQAHSSRNRSVAISNDGKLAATASHDHTVKIWNMATFKPVATLRGHEQFVRGVAFSPTNPLLLASTGRNSEVKLWDLKTFTERTTLRGFSNGHVCCFSLDGQQLITAGRKSIAIWDHIADRLDTLDIGEPVRDLELSASGQLLAVLSMEDNLVVRDVSSGAITTQPFGREKINSICVSGQSILAAGGKDGRILLYDLDHNRRLDPFGVGDSGSVTAVSFSPSAQVLAVGCGNGRVIALSPTRQSNLWTSVPADSHSQSVTRVAFSQDGELVASASKDHTVNVWNAETGELIRHFPDHKDWVSALAFAPTTPTFVATGSWDGTIKIWDPRSGEVTRSFVGDSIAHKLTFIDENAILAALSDGTVKFLDVSTGEQRFRLRAHNDAVYGLALSSDKRLLVSGGRHDHLLRFWRIASPGEVERSGWYDRPISQTDLGGL